MIEIDEDAVGSPPVDLGAERRRLEAAIAREGEALAAIVGLIVRGVPFDHWPQPLIDALRTALSEPDNRIEAGKARALARHLFRSAAAPLDARGSDAPTHEDLRLAERIRADLAGLVPLGAGLPCVAGRNPA